tara:strand:+ start:713 stop:1012 length:300 start_codon:yes stop_codon:yes gene_type:complete
LKKFDLEAYVRRRLQELRGQQPEHRPLDQYICRYTTERIRQLQGKQTYNLLSADVDQQMTLRMREWRLENELRERKLSLDNRKLGSYTVATMEDKSGKS